MKTSQWIVDTAMKMAEEHNKIELERRAALSETGSYLPVLKTSSHFIPELKRLAKQFNEEAAE